MWKSHEVTLESVCIANTPGNFVTTAVSEAALDYGGIPGDLHFGLTKLSGVRESMYPRGTEIFNRRQITIVSVEECTIIVEKLGIKIKNLNAWRINNDHKSCHTGRRKPDCRADGVLHC